MDDYVSESDSDYTSYWRDWVGCTGLLLLDVFEPRDAIAGRVRPRTQFGGSAAVFWVHIAHHALFAVYILQGKRVLL
jgi:hypothetical protein